MVRKQITNRNIEVVTATGNMRYAIDTGLLKVQCKIVITTNQKIESKLNMIMEASKTIEAKTGINIPVWKY